jgi:F0F1-type ATP synthase assembly protein I
MPPESTPPVPLWRFAAIGIEFFSPILGGSLLGYYSDDYFHTAPALAVTGLLLGVFLGMYRLIVELRDFQRGQSPPPPQP